MKYKISERLLIAALCVFGPWFSLHAQSSVATLHSFTGVDGDDPQGANLILSGNRLYGTTPWGGSAGRGTVFALNIDGTGFTNLHHCTGGIAGSYPQGPLVLLNDVLYGTASGGG